MSGENKIKRETGKNKEVSVSILGFEMNASRFTVILPWAGMISCCVPLMIAYMAFVTTSSDPWSKYLHLNGRNSFNLVPGMVSTCLNIGGGVMMVISLIFYPKYFLLKNEKDQEGAMKILRTICYIKGGITITIISSLLTVGIFVFFCTHAGYIGSTSVLELTIDHYLGVFLPLLLSITTITIFYSLKINGVGTQESQHIEAFLDFKHFVLLLFTFLFSLVFSGLLIAHNQLWILLLGIWATFLWIFYTSFSLTIFTIMLNDMNCKINQDDSTIFIIMKNDSTTITNIKNNL